MRLFRPTLRIRMALLYGGLVLLVGISLLFTSIVLLQQSIKKVAIFESPGLVTYVDPKTGKAITDNPANLGNEAQRTAVSTLLHSGLIYFAIIVVIGTVGGYLLAKQALRPIAKLTATARQMSTENLDHRIDLGGPDDELRELADTFDEMLARLDAAFDSQRLFVANASHELRTPLSVMRTELEVTLGDPGADVEELRRMGEVLGQATERAQRLVDSLLTLARLQAVKGGELEVHESVDLADVVPDVLRAVEAEAKLAVARERMRAVGQLHLKEAVALDGDVEFAARRLRFAGDEIDPRVDLREKHRHARVVTDARAGVGLDFAGLLRRKVDRALAVARRLARRDVLSHGILPTLECAEGGGALVESDVHGAGGRNKPAARRC